MVNKERTLEVVGMALNYQFDTYSWHDMIDDITGLSDEEKDWAKEHICYKAYVVGEVKL